MIHNNSSLPLPSSSHHRDAGIELHILIKPLIILFRLVDPLGFEVIRHQLEEPDSLLAHHVAQEPQLVLKHGDVLALLQDPVLVSLHAARCV